MEDFKCSKCDDFTVSKDIEWAVPGTEYDEVMYNVYTCSKCGGTCSIRERDDTTEEGDYVHIEN